MKLTIMLAVLLTLTGCLRAGQQSVLRIMAETPTYIIGEQNSTTYIVWAVNATEAQKAARIHLCEERKRVCILQSGGVVLQVVRPDVEQQETK